MFMLDQERLNLVLINVNISAVQSFAVAFSRQYQSNKHVLIIISKS